jgi:hypothetical protein
MTESRRLALFIKGNGDIADATLSRSDSGGKLDEGVRELVANEFPGYEIAVTAESSSGFTALRRELEDGTATMLTAAPDIVLLSIADDVRTLGSHGTNAETAVQNIRTDLVAIVDIIKDKLGAHVLVANASTIDPSDATYNYFGLTEEPLPLRVHRLAHMLIGVSHEEGVSIIDVDRLIAEMGAADNVEAAFSYSPKACAAIAAEVVRVLEDYGFFDERTLVAQVGAKGRSK